MVPTKKFSARQLRLIELLADLDDTRSKDEKSVAAGYAAKHIYRLQKDPHFAGAVYQRMKSHLRINLLRVYQSLLERAANGDIKAAELILKSAGEIQSGVNVQTNVMQSAYHDDPEGFRDAFKKAQEHREERTRKARARHKMEVDRQEIQKQLDEIEIPENDKDDISDY